MTRPDTIQPDASVDLDCRAPYFDRALNTWILSRYADVSAALQQAELWPAAQDDPNSSENPDRVAHFRIRTEASRALPGAKLSEWRVQASKLANNISAALMPLQIVDVVGEFARPWAIEFAVLVTSCKSTETAKLVALAEMISRSTASPEDSALKKSAAQAESDLQAALAETGFPMAGPAFVALSQTLPALLANAWLVLLTHEAEFEQLRRDESLIPNAIEELLRIAGLTRVLHRRALADIIIGETTIRRGERVDLRIALANHDPERFVNPHQLNFSRRVRGQFTMGAGSHLCVASALIHMAMEVATTELVRSFNPAGQNNEQASAVEWLGGSGFRWPARLLAQKRG